MCVLHASVKQDASKTIGRPRSLECLQQQHQQQQQLKMDKEPLYSSSSSISTSSGTTLTCRIPRILQISRNRPLSPARCLSVCLCLFQRLLADQSMSSCVSSLVCPEKWSHFYVESRSLNDNNNFFHAAPEAFLASGAKFRVDCGTAVDERKIISRNALHERVLSR